MSGQPDDPDTFTPALNTRYYFTGDWVKFEERSGLVQKISPTPGFEIMTTQLVANRYIDYTVPGDL